MQFKRRTTAWTLAAVWILWDLVLKPILTLNVENVAQRNHMDTVLGSGGRIMTYVSWFASYVPSSFGLGFVVGALLFAYWDAIADRFPMLRRDKAIHVPTPALGLRAWCGSILFDTAKIGSDGHANLWVSFINCGDTPISIGKVSGFMKVIYWDSYRVKRTFDLPAPLISSLSQTEKVLEPLHFTDLVLHQTIKSDLEDIFRGGRFGEKSPSIDLRNLIVEIIGDNGERKNLKLWQGVSLKRDVPSSMQCYYLN